MSIQFFNKFFLLANEMSKNRIKIVGELLKVNLMGVLIQYFLT